jgi:hypothetical protein
VADCCGCGSEPSGAIKCGEFLDRAAESGFGLRWKIFFGAPSKGWPARVKVRKQSTDRRMQDGRWPQCHQHDKSQPNYVWYYRERQKHIEHKGLRAPSGPPGPGILYRLAPPPPPGLLVGTCSWLAEDMLVSREGLCSMELVSVLAIGFHSKYPLPIFLNIPRSVKAIWRTYKLMSCMIISFRKLYVC